MRKKDVTTADIEELLLGARPKYSRFEVADAAQVPAPALRRYWRALGFANAADDAKVLTDADILAAKTLRRLLEEGVVTPEEGLRIARALGQTTSRLADWFFDEFLERVRKAGVVDAEPTQEAAAGGVSEDTQKLVYDVIAAGLPSMEELVVYAWRRHLAAVFARVTSPGAGDVETTMAVGFADLVSFTRMSKRMELAELATLVDTFESVASDIVAAHHGRLVKTLGDEVLFVATDPVEAAEIGLQLQERLAAYEDVPDIRVGMAYGEVLPRMGDVFGTTVNRASRLTSVAAPGTIVIDGAFAEALANAPAYQLSQMRRRALRGLGLVEAVRLRRAR